MSYIGRYLKRPILSQSRILAYDRENVTFSYKDKYDKISETKFQTLPDANVGMELLTAVSITDNSAAIVASHLISSNVYDIYLTGDTSKTPFDSTYNKNEVALDITGGMSSTTFTGLKPGYNYLAYIVKNQDLSVPFARYSFKTTGNSPASSTPPVVKTSFYTKLVPECNTGEIDKVTGQYKNACDFGYFMKLINNIIKFLLFTIATPLMALIIMYTGYLYITAGGNAGQTEKVKHILFSAVVGYVIALAAWLIVNTILKSFGVDPSINMFLK